MSAKGQNTKSIRKKSLNNTRLPVVGMKNYKLHHQANVGEQYIDLTNLAVPAGTSLGNPSPSEIAKMRLKDFSNNWTLTSTHRPHWMEGLSFEIVTNNTIKLLDGFEALEDEVFTIQYFNHTVNGTVIADVRTPNASGELLEGQTDFNLGEAIPINELSSQWPIQVFRGTTGRPMLRNANNAVYAGDDSIGNYQMVDRGDGYCQVIRFNIAGDVGNEPVMWANHGALGERPDLSVLQRVDKIHGIVDKMREDLLVTTGNDIADPTRYDEGVPTQSDLKAFGDKVHQNEKDIETKLNYFRKYWGRVLLDGAYNWSVGSYSVADFDGSVGGDFGDGNLVSAGVFTCPSDGEGLWKFRGAIYANDGSVGFASHFNHVLTKNKTTLATFTLDDYCELFGWGVADQYPGGPVEGRFYLKPGDTVRMYAYQNSGPSRTSLSDSRSNFQFERVSGPDNNITKS